MHKIAALAVLLFSVWGAPPPCKLTASPGKISVVPAGGWHVNVEYPWRAVLKDGSSRQFSLQWNSAVAVGLPKGPASVKGSLCSATTCVAVSVKVEVP